MVLCAVRHYGTKQPSFSFKFRAGVRRNFSFFADWKKRMFSNPRFECFHETKWWQAFSDPEFMLCTKRHWQGPCVQQPDSLLLAIVWWVSVCECVNSREQASNCVLTITSPSRASINHNIKTTKVKMDNTGLTMWYSAGKVLVDTKGHKPPDLTATALQLKYTASGINTRGLHCSLSRTVLAGTWQNLFRYSPRDVT